MVQLDGNQKQNWILQGVDMVTINVLDLRVNTIRKNSEELAYGIPHVFSTCAQFWKEKNVKLCLN